MLGFYITEKLGYYKEVGILTFKIFIPKECSQVLGR